MGSVALVKTPRSGPPRDSSRAREAAADDGFNRVMVLERLFNLPVPPLPSTRRTYPIHTPVGRLMRLRMLTVREMSRCQGVPDVRVMCEILAGRKAVGGYREALADALGVDARVL